MKMIVAKFNWFTIRGKLSILFILLLVVIGVFFKYITPYPHNVPSGATLESPSKSHLLGTDDLGIDLLAQICFGAKISLTIGFFASFLSGMGGGILGILSGYYGGIVDKVIMRITDMMIILPDLPMMIFLGAFFGPSLKNIIIVLVFFSWTSPARVVRSKMISIKNENYIIAAKSYGAGFFHLLGKHFIPEILPIFIVTIIRLTSKAIVAEAELAFLGLGDPTSKSWGLMLNHAINFKGIYFTNYWKWWIMAPLMATILLVLAIAFISRDLEKILNEKL